MGDSPLISVVIPALNEEEALPATLSRLDAQAGGREVLVVDGGSTDATSAIAGSHPGVCLLHAPRGRARQMNAGAAQARGSWLLFLHADTLLPRGALEMIRTLDGDDPIGAGGFRQRFSGRDWRLRLVSRLDNFRCERTRVVYGDQALFVRRDLFRSLGGFDDVPFLEDVLLGERLRQVTAIMILEAEVVTDSRRFEQQGIWRSLFRVLRIQIAHELGLPVPAREFFTEIR